MSTNQPDLDSLFLAALEIQSPQDRAAFLDASCGADHELRQQVERRLRSHEQAGNFLEQPTVDVEATIATDAACQDLAAALDAGLSPTLAEDQAVGIGNASHSVLKTLAPSMEVPRVMLRDAAESTDDPIVRPKSAEMPQRDLGSRY